MTTTIVSKSRVNKTGEDQQAITGIKLDLQTMSSIPMGASTYTPSSLAAAIQARIDAAAAVGTTRAAWLNAVKIYDVLDLQVTVLMRELKNLVIATFGPTSPKLADFGFKATVRTPLTPAQKVARAAKAAATRKARGTLGKKQKALITGVTAAAAAAAASATAPTTTPAPAPAPAPAAPAPVTPQAPAPAAPAAATPVTPHRPRPCRRPPRLHPLRPPLPQRRPRHPRRTPDGGAAAREVATRNALALPAPWRVQHVVHASGGAGERLRSTPQSTPQSNQTRNPMKMYCHFHKHTGDQKVADAIRAVVTLDVLHVGQRAYSPGALAALLERRVGAARAVDSARAFWIETEQAYREIDAEASVAVRDLRGLAIGLFGPDSPVAQVLGAKAPRKGK